MSNGDKKYKIAIQDPYYGKATRTDRDVSGGYYDDKEVWSNIPIDYERHMDHAEALARGLYVQGLLEYHKKKEENPDILKYSIVISGHPDFKDGLYYFSVHPKMTEKFYKAFEEGGKYYDPKNPDRKPFLIIDDKMSTKEMISKLREGEKVNFEDTIDKSRIIEPLNTTQHLQEEIKFAIKNNNAALVDNLYTHMINNLDSKILNKINPRVEKASWQFTYDNYLLEQKRLAEEDKVPDAKDFTEIKKVDTSGGGFTIIDDPTSEHGSQIVFDVGPKY